MMDIISDPTNLYIAESTPKEPRMTATILNFPTPVSVEPTFVHATPEDLGITDDMEIMDPAPAEVEADWIDTTFEVN